MSPDVRLQVESPYKRDAFASKSSRVTLQGDEYNANQKSSIADILATAENSANVGLQLRRDSLRWCDRIGSLGVAAKREEIGAKH